jgi:hypothetical protein
VQRHRICETYSLPCLLSVFYLKLSNAQHSICKTYPLPSHSQSLLSSHLSCTETSMARNKILLANAVVLSPKTQNPKSSLRLFSTCFSICLEKCFEIKKHKCKTTEEILFRKCGSSLTTFQTKQVPFSFFLFCLHSLKSHLIS